MNTIHIIFIFFLFSSRIVGFFNFNKPQLIICDTKIVQKILIENSDHFVNQVHQFSDNQSLDSLNYHQWNEIKNSLDVIFDDRSMKQMFELILKSTDKMIEYLNFKEENEDLIQLFLEEAENEDDFEFYKIA